MAIFGKLGWGVATWGAVPAGQRGEDIESPSSGHEDGTPQVGRGSYAEDVYLSASEFRKSVFFGADGTPVTAAQARAFIAAHSTPAAALGGSAVYSMTLKAKSWASHMTEFVRDYLNGVNGISGTIKIWYRVTRDFPVLIKIWVKGIQDLGTALYPTRIRDFPALFVAVPPEDILAALQSVPPANLPSYTLAIPPVNLGARGGGHFPAYLLAFVSVTQPEDFPAYIIGGYSGLLDLGATLSQTGAFVGMAGFMKVLLPAAGNLTAQLKTIGVALGNLPASMQPIHLADLAATLVTERVYDLCALILGVNTNVVANITAIITSLQSGQVDLPVEMLRAMQGGITSMMADILARISREDLTAFIRGFISSTVDLSAQVTSVAPFININKVVLSLLPLIDLDAFIIQRGGFSPVRATITARHHASTYTASDAGFTTIASSYRFYLGTTRGLFSPPGATPIIKVTSYSNVASLPDLHATVTGNHVSNLGASISYYPYVGMGAYISPTTADRLRDFNALVYGYRATDITASLSVSGGYTALPATLIVAGASAGLGAILIPYIDTLALSVVSISTVPVANLGALINYGSLVPCSPTTMLASMGAFIRPAARGIFGAGYSLGATINALSATSALSGAIIGRKRTRISILSLTFRARTRGSERVRASINPVVPRATDLAVDIRGLLHEVDFPASLTPVRYSPYDAEFTAVENLVNLKTGAMKDVLVSFRSQVSSYVYDEITSAVYSTDRGTWTIDLRTTTPLGSFFDRSPENRKLVLSGIYEFYSLDEAIRGALVMLCERRQQSIGAVLTTRGAVARLVAHVGVVDGDHLSSLPSKLVAVFNSPDLPANINLGPFTSSLSALGAIVTSAYVNRVASLSGYIFGAVSGDIAASIEVA